MSTKKNKPKYSDLLQLAKKQFKDENYSGAVCSLTSLIDYQKFHKNDQITIEAKFWLAKTYEKGFKNKTDQAVHYYHEVFNSSNLQFKEKARDCLINCYSQGIGVKKDIVKADELYNGKFKNK
ncbi:19663_t:CDS:1 [Racocetra fulgida]|uniref:19663_t:CDS:1 n=1 Tax=Racocetra fulgida TaxID=60492 RepID=A0A9N9CLQ2_9GLOM|nr:19663_t:CDS:1 [Racocetra fulgida]